MRRGWLAAAFVGVSLAFTAAGSASRPALPPVQAALGAYRVLVVLATWGPEPFTQEAVQQVVFDRVDAFYRKSSYGKLWLTGTVTPWLHAFNGPVGCDLPTISRAARAAASSAGYDAKTYQAVIYIHPAAGCPWSGVTVGGEIWLNGNLSSRVVAHELGHSLGLAHANTTICTQHSCDALEYGDPYDTMGTGTGDFSAYSKWKLGWLTAVRRAGSSGLYDIEPLERAAAGPHAFVVTTAHDQYWLEDRTVPAISEAGAQLSDPGVLVHVSPSPDGRGVSVDLLTNLLLVDPAKRARPELHPGDRFEQRGIFNATLVKSSESGAQLRFDWTDNVPPAAPRLLSPGARAAAGGAIVVRWVPAVEMGSGVDYYVVSVDGRRVRVNGEATDLSVAFRSPGAGRHTVRVFAVDRAGNRSAASIRSVRISR